MNDSYCGAGFCGPGSAFRGWHGGYRARRGDIGPIILRTLQEKPMHGYEIISKLEERSHGMWRPSAGSVYPTLQLLEEQELIASSEADGKKIYELTKKGKTEAEKAEDEYKAPWEEHGAHAQHFGDMRMTLFEAMDILRHIAAQGSEQKSEAAKKILDETKQKLEELNKPDDEAQT